MSDLKQMIADAFKEAGEREARFADADTMSRTRVVGDSLPTARIPKIDRKNPDEVATLMVDSRTCGCCGARWGKCEHTL